LLVLPPSLVISTEPAVFSQVVEFRAGGSLGLVLKQMPPVGAAGGTAAAAGAAVSAAASGPWVPAMREWAQGSRGSGLTVAKFNLIDGESGPAERAGVPAGAEVCAVAGAAWPRTEADSSIHSFVSLVKVPTLLSAALIHSALLLLLSLLSLSWLLQ
jgi:hypothetical protein